MTINRRKFIKNLGIASLGVASSPSSIFANTHSSKHVVVIGGGFGGATAAKYLRLWSNGDIKVTLIDPLQQHTSCVMSNLVLNERQKLKNLRLYYETLKQKYGVEHLKDKVLDIDSYAQKIDLKYGESISYDKLIISTGIGFKKVSGHDFRKVPHAWIAGSQTNILKNQLAEMSAGDTFVMSIPKSPYRCPPGPYERACVVADMLKRRGGGNVIVLDANEGIQAEKHTFSSAFNGIYSNIIDYRTNVTINEVDSDAREVYTSDGTFEADVLNIIPNQKANRLLNKAGMTDGDWAPVDPVSYESTIFNNVHIIGDAQATNQPKSAHMANSQAKVCADAIIRSLNNLSLYSFERLENITTNSACYSPITYNEASWLTANFAYDGVSSMKLKHLGEAKEWSRENYKEMYAWANNLFFDSFY